MPRVSVVTGYFNRRPLLERTIRSILAQSFVDFELIVFDDASTDGTAEELARLAAELNDPRFRYIVHGENLGFVGGLIDAIRIAQGDYIAIQGSGDVSHPNRLAKQVEVLDARPEVSVVGAWYRSINPRTKVTSLVAVDAALANGETLLERNFFSHGEVMIRRSTYDAVGGYRREFKYAQDRELWIRVARRGAFATVPEILYDRYVLDDGVSFKPEKASVQARYSILARRLNQLSPERRAGALELLATQGPSSLINDDDQELQQHFRRQAYGIGVNTMPAEAIRFAQATIVDRRWLRAITWFFVVYESPVGFVLRVGLAARQRTRRVVGVIRDRRRTRLTRRGLEQV